MISIHFQSKMSIVLLCYDVSKIWTNQLFLVSSDLNEIVLKCLKPRVLDTPDSGIQCTGVLPHR